jgi:hypothetical protein
MSMSNIEGQCQGPVERDLYKEEFVRCLIADVRWEKDEVSILAFLGDEGERELRITLGRRQALELTGELISAALVADEDNEHY